MTYAYSLKNIAKEVWNFPEKLHILQYTSAKNCSKGSYLLVLLIIIRTLFMLTDTHII